MAREQVKQILPLLQAYAEGKTVQIKEDNGWVDLDELSFAEPLLDSYRVKPEPTYRPFKDADECWEEMQKHQPFGWVRRQYDGGYFLVDSIEESRGHHGSSSFTFKEALERCTFIDGTPFGIEVKEE